MASSPGARDDAGAPERRPEPFDTDIVTFSMLLIHSLLHNR